MVDARTRLPNPDSVSIFHGVFVFARISPPQLTQFVTASVFLSISSSLPFSPPLPPTTTTASSPHPARESGVSLSRPKHTGKVLKKARLRCAFAISSTLLSPTFFLFLYSTLYLTTCITTSLSS